MGWRFIRNNATGSLVATTPDGKAIELRASDMGNTRARELFDLMARALIEAREEIVVDDKLLADYRRVLDAVPECPDHGHCVPHALQWIGDRTSPGAELLTWHPASEKPDSDITVLLTLINDNEPTWPGYWDDGEGRWCTAEGMPIELPTRVLSWADMPEGFTP
jgi:hypothetical protein